MKASKRDKEDFIKTREFSKEIVKLCNEHPNFDPIVFFSSLCMCMVTLGKSMEMPVKAFQSALGILSENYENMK